ADTFRLTLGGEGVKEVAFRMAVLGLSTYTAAFVCESVRSGINTVPVGQAEAARALGLNFTQVLTLIVLPQAFRTVIGPLANVLIALTKNTTVAAAIGVADGSGARPFAFPPRKAPRPFPLGPGALQDYLPSDRRSWA
ncbi:ABC transporter permease subunit, partial [Streptomyces goshikiensis]|uniref:ABC transporter permease subunit n=1 Tax=Streptomyces goshikiensis TaxID=1942 RepID=UPI00366356D5